MQLFLQRLRLALVSGLIIFCCSCERHHLGELPVEQETKGIEKHAAGSHAPTSPDTRTTPANFFPDKPKP